MKTFPIVLHGSLYSLQATELTAEISSLQQQLQDQQDKASAAAAKQASTHEQQLQQLQQRLHAAVSKGAAQYAEALESAGQLRGRVKELEGLLELIKAERDALQVRQERERVALQHAISFLLVGICRRVIVVGISFNGKHEQL